ncbi:Hus1-like protein [Onchocerca flexuosa]|uniref:Hus1-like protein n=1 Tax=Onchocerca flexuosa TaxID=387005 RepID=A0A238BUT5_9BILA|nr:Hus1-like protein [Onchocerca flexuosa]
MKFLAVLAESGAADTLSMTLRITPDAIYLLNPCPLANNGNYLQITLNVGKSKYSAEFFSTYIMGGVSEEFNEIYMEVGKDYLFRSMNVKDRSTKIRLVKLGNIPHLKVEQRSYGMTYELPIVLIPTKYWKTYDMPALNNISVALYLPSLSTIRNLVTSFKNMGVKYLEIKGNQKGELQFCGDLDMANIVVHFSNLSVVSLQNDDVNDVNDPGVLQIVRIDIRAVHLFLRSIVPEKMAIFSLEQNEASLLYIYVNDVGIVLILKKVKSSQGRFVMIVLAIGECKIYIFNLRVKINHHALDGDEL